MPKVATPPDKPPGKEEMLRMSGLEAMQSMLNGDHPGPPIARAMGYRLHSVEKGKAIFRGAPTFDVTNPMGTVHGGWYGTVLDSAMACAVMTMIPAGTMYTTLEYKINILKAIPLGTMVESLGVTDHVGRSTGVAHGEIRGLEDGRLYATGSTTCIIMKLA